MFGNNDTAISSAKEFVKELKKRIATNERKRDAQQANMGSLRWDARSDKNAALKLDATRRDYTATLARIGRDNALLKQLEAWIEAERQK